MTLFDSKIDTAALGKVAVLMGGASAEREVSIMSGSGVLQALRARGVDAHAFYPAHTGLNVLQQQGYARCFIALHGRHRRLVMILSIAMLDGNTPEPV